MVRHALSRVNVLCQSACHVKVLSFAKFKLFFDLAK